MTTLKMLERAAALVVVTLAIAGCHNRAPVEDASDEVAQATPTESGAAVAADGQAQPLAFAALLPTSDEEISGSISLRVDDTALAVITDLNELPSGTYNVELSSRPDCFITENGEEQLESGQDLMDIGVIQATQEMPLRMKWWYPVISSLEQEPLIGKSLLITSEDDTPIACGVIREQPVPSQG